MVKKGLIILFALFLSFQILVGCESLEIGVDGGSSHSDEETVALDGAESAAVKMNVIGGKINVDAGTDAANLMEATFDYSGQSKPEVSYEVSGGNGDLTISQPDVSQSIINRSDWEVHLNEATPLDLILDLGAAKNDLTLSGLTLNSLDVDIGSGQTTIDLSGDWKQSFDVNVEAGIGDTTIKLPKDVGVIVNTSKGIGKISADGLTVNDDTYTNQAYENADVTITLDVSVGVGKINLEVIE